MKVLAHRLPNEFARGSFYFNNAARTLYDGQLVAAEAGMYQAIEKRVAKLKYLTLCIDGGTLEGSHILACSLLVDSETYILKPGIITGSPNCDAIVKAINQALASIGKTSADVAFLVSDGAKVNRSVLMALGVNNEENNNVDDETAATNDDDNVPAQELDVGEILATEDVLINTGVDPEDQLGQPLKPGSAMRTAIMDIARCNPNVPLNTIKPVPVACLAHYIHVAIRWVNDAAGGKYFTVLFPFKNNFTRMFFGAPTRKQRYRSFLASIKGNQGNIVARLDAIQKQIDFIRFQDFNDPSAVAATLRDVLAQQESLLVDSFDSEAEFKTFLQQKAQSRRDSRLATDGSAQSRRSASGNGMTMMNSSQQRNHIGNQGIKLFSQQNNANDEIAPGFDNDENINSTGNDVVWQAEQSQNPHLTQLNNLMALASQNNNNNNLDENPADLKTSLIEYLQETIVANHQLIETIKQQDGGAKLGSDTRYASQLIGSITHLNNNLRQALMFVQHELGTFVQNPDSMKEVVRIAHSQKEELKAEMSLYLASISPISALLQKYSDPSSRCQAHVVQADIAQTINSYAVLKESCQYASPAISAGVHLLNGQQIAFLMQHQQKIKENLKCGDEIADAILLDGELVKKLGEISAIYVDCLKEDRWRRYVPQTEFQNRSLWKLAAFLAPINIFNIVGSPDKKDRDGKIQEFDESFKKFSGTYKNPNVAHTPHINGFSKVEKQVVNQFSALVSSPDFQLPVGKYSSRLRESNPRVFWSWLSKETAEKGLPFTDLCEVAQAILSVPPVVTSVDTFFSVAGHITDRFKLIANEKAVRQAVLFANGDWMCSNPHFRWFFGDTRSFAQKKQLLLEQAKQNKEALEAMLKNK
jgi:hypothetical protein